MVIVVGVIAGSAVVVVVVLMVAIFCCLRSKSKGDHEDAPGTPAVEHSPRLDGSKASVIAHEVCCGSGRDISYRLSV